MADTAFGKRSGFNFQWLMHSHDKGAEAADEKALDFLVKHGFNFVRLPTNYYLWVKDFDYFHPIEASFVGIDKAIEACRSRGLHVSLNCHRVPGYCINSPEIEKHNLWVDDIAQDALVFQWENFARRYSHIPNEELSFDLINEPPHEGDRGFTRAIHEKVIRRVVAAIRAISPDRTITANGLEGGHLAIPELSDLEICNSGRGYQPMLVSHYHAEWWAPAADMDPPVYPGGIWDGRSWDKNTLRAFYLPWKQVEAKGVPIHIGECGCYNKTPNDVAQRWLHDLFTLLAEYGWGFGVWNFVGTFGIIDHGRQGAKFENIDGYMVDREYLELLKECAAKIRNS